MHNTADDDEITDINVTPLVDIMLVLLIIFMMTTTYIVHRSINVSLPKAETGETATKTENLAFVLDQNSNLFLDGKPIVFDDINVAIRERRASSSKKLQALISADQSTPHGKVIKLIDLVRKNGITEFAINVEEASAKP